MAVLLKMGTRISPAMRQRRTVREIRRLAIRGLNEAGDRALRLMKARRFIPKATGGLEASIRKTINRARLTVTLMSRLARAFYMEFGRRPGRWPPRAKIAAWARQRRLRPEPGMTFEGMVYVLSRAIGTRGIKIPLRVTGRGAMFARTTRAMEKIFPRIMRRHLGR